MLAVGDKCIYREDCYGIPELGVIGGFNDTDEDYVFFEPLFSSGMCRWVRKDRVTKVKSVNDSTICRSSEVSFALSLTCWYNAAAGDVCFGLPLCCKRRAWTKGPKNVVKYCQPLVRQ